MMFMPKYILKIQGWYQKRYSSCYLKKERNQWIKLTKVFRSLKNIL
jgi:hypothetical protein